MRRLFKWFISLFKKDKNELDDVRDITEMLKQLNELPDKKVYVGTLKKTTPEISEQNRIIRLQERQGLKFFDVNGLKFLALNRRNAERKYNNLMSQA